MNRRLGLAAALTVVFAGLAAGCSAVSADDIMSEPQVSTDALPVIEAGVMEHLDSSSARYLGEAERTRFWAVRDDERGFCVVAQSAADPDDVMSGCGVGDENGLTISGRGFATATWSSVADPEVPEGATLLRGHLVVR